MISIHKKNDHNLTIDYDKIHLYDVFLPEMCMTQILSSRFHHTAICVDFDLALKGTRKGLNRSEIEPQIKYNSQILLFSFNITSKKRKSDNCEHHLQNEALPIFLKILPINSSEIHKF